MLPCPAVDELGDAGRGTSSAGCFRPLLVAVSGDFWVPLVVMDGMFPAFGVGCGALAFPADSSCLGEGRGGGMPVPSVKEPNLKSRAGSWNLWLPFPRDGILLAFGLGWPRDMICGGFGVRLSVGEGRRWTKVDVAGVVRGKLTRDGWQSKRPRWFGVEGT